MPCRLAIHPFLVTPLAYARVSKEPLPLLGSRVSKEPGLHLALLTLTSALKTQMRSTFRTKDQSNREERVRRLLLHKLPSKRE